jgi:hypothetical protein
MLQEAEIRAAMLQAIRGLNREITELREDFTLATQTLLVSAGKIDPTEAESWVAENFPP